MRLSCAFATSLETHQHAKIAESLGYERAFFYDSPALYPDVWVQLCRAAEITERIVLGPGVLIPHLRHPMVTASAVGTLASIAGPERVVIGAGTGFTGRMAMGKRGLPWATVSEYVLAVQALLRGEEVQWDGAIIRMLHPDGRFAPPLPIEVDWFLAANGPKGQGVARDLGIGVMSGLVPVAGFESSTFLDFGTVLEDGEDPGSPRAIEAAGHAAALLLHFGLEYDALDQLLPGIGKEWAAAYADLPPERRHLALHDRHMVAVNDRDRPFVTGEVLAASGVAMSAKQWREKIDGLAEAGVTEIAFQPGGSDIPRELAQFASAFHS